MAATEMGGVRADAELDEYAKLTVWAFGPSLDHARKWVAAAGKSNIRVARRGDRVVAGLGELPMGQWFGGKSLAMLGVAGVCVAPDARDQGLARDLMTNMLRDARARGFALSMLYPSTLPLYRSVGYELAGSHYGFSLRVEDMPRPKRGELEVQRVTPDDLDEIEATYRAVAQGRAGYLDRGARIWQRTREPDFEPVPGFVARSSRGIEGYVYVAQVKGPEPGFALSLTDFVTRTPAALDAIFRFLANHRTTVSEVRFRGGVADARFLGFPEPILKSELRTTWMLRLVDVGKALLGRGYPHRSGEVDLQLEDPLLPENGGRYRLRVRDGEPELTHTREPGGARVGVRALAALYSGYVDAHELAVAGLLEAEDSNLARLSALFAGPAPACPDYF